MVSIHFKPPSPAARTWQVLLFPPGFLASAEFLGAAAASSHSDGLRLAPPSPGQPSDQVDAGFPDPALLGKFEENT